MMEKSGIAPAILEEECTMSFSRSGGRGGQKVNKTSSKVTLFWYPHTSAALSEEQKARLLGSPVVRNVMNSEGAVVLQEERSRSQAENRIMALERLGELVARALVVKRRRKRTKAPRSSIERRVRQKKHRAEIKRFRGRVDQE